MKKKKGILHFVAPCGIVLIMKVLKSSRARRVFADLASQGQLSAFVASTTTVQSAASDPVKVHEFVVRHKAGEKIRSIKTRVVNRYEEEALPA